MTMEVIDGLEDEEAVSDDAAAESDTPDEETTDPDPVAALTARLDAFEKDYGHLKGFDPNPVKAGLGRLPAIQSAIDDLKKSGNLTADVIERLDLSDKALGTLATLMVGDAEQSEAVKAPFRAYTEGMERARTQRERNSLRTELLEEMKPAAQTTGETEPAPNPWDEATVEIRNLATELGVPLDTIPWKQFEDGANGSALRATRLATAWLHDNKPTTDSTTRVAERRRSAGSGSPPREGSASASYRSAADVAEAYSAGTIDGETYRKELKRFTDARV